MNAVRRLALLLAAAALLAAAGAPAWAQCAMCQTALTGSAEGRGMAGHLNAAILLMFAAPYLVVGTFLLIAFRRRVGRALSARLAKLRALPVALPAVQLPAGPQRSSR